MTKHPTKINTLLLDIPGRSCIILYKLINSRNKGAKTMLIKSDADTATTNEVTSMLDHHGPECLDYLERKFSLLILQDGVNAFEIYQLPAIEEV